MSDVARAARRLAGALLPAEPASHPPHLSDVDAALRELRDLVPLDAHDEAALHEAGETLLRLREAAAAGATRVE